MIYRKLSISSDMILAHGFPTRFHTDRDRCVHYKSTSNLFEFSVRYTPLEYTPHPLYYTPYHLRLTLHPLRLHHHIVQWETRELRGGNIHNSEKS